MESNLEQHLTPPHLHYLAFPAWSRTLKCLDHDSREIGAMLHFYPSTLTCHSVQLHCFDSPRPLSSTSLLPAVEVFTFASPFTTAFTTWLLMALCCPTHTAKLTPLSFWKHCNFSKRSRTPAKLHLISSQ